MKLLPGFTQPERYQDGWVAIGNFDGVHLGHQSMIDRLLKRSAEMGGPSVVLTFDPHPIELLRPDQTPPSLSTVGRKAELLTHYGVDIVIAYPTDMALLEMSPQAFFQSIVVDRLRARGLVEGPNFYFGKNRQGDTQLLATLCESAGLQLDVVAPVLHEGELVSSSAIRQLVGGGDLDRAVQLLGHAYQIHGRVVEGAGRGRLLGFPTANLDGIETLLPGVGVYAGLAHVDESVFQAAIHLGPTPTFGTADVRVEVHLLDFQGDLYGQSIDVDFLSRIRGVSKFESREQLQQQLHQDLQAIRERLDGLP